ncbi:hypothetical protein OE88DRAFT_1737234 [Heliocybe sulcata]|uniref:Uncharacterized protein n=1 Tax=Heliocybe sulcata TaxID=5364 RepID=A0A5C3MVA3_9AGAM|nr:hypothetical protein OE88DRAFT_1737234 [Heliocybe sulcata]
MSSSPKSRPMAALTMALTTTAIFGLYFAGKRSKAEEQSESPYHSGQMGADNKTGSAGVREAMHSSTKNS